MSDDTTDDALTDKDPASATRAAVNLADAEPRSKEARRTTAALLNRSILNRFTAVARQTVALGLVEAGAEKYAALDSSDAGRGFPEGSDYGALCPQDDLSKTRAESIHEAAVKAVQAEAQHMTQSNPRTAAVVAEQLAEWEEGAAIEWANMKRIREELDREDEEERQEEAAAKDKGMPKDNMEDLTAAQTSRLRVLLDARTDDPDWPKKADEGLAVMSTPEGRLALLLFCAGGQILRRMDLLTWDQFRAILEGRGDPLPQRRLSRAMRLLKRVLMMGCLQRGEVR